MLLEKIEQTNAPELKRPRRVMLYGTHGIGKSTFGACAPDPIFIRTEDGLQDIEAKAFPLAKNIADVMQAIDELRNEPHEFKTCVIDSADWLEQVIAKQICSQGNKESLSDFGYQTGFDKAATMYSSVLDSLGLLNVEREMLIVFIAHCKIEKVNDPRTESYDRYSPKLDKRVSAVLQEWCDEVLFTGYKVYTKKDGQGFNERKLGVGSGERVIYTTEKPSHLAKNRLSGIPEEMPLAFESYWQHAQLAV